MIVGTSILIHQTFYAYYRNKIKIISTIEKKSRLWHHIIYSLPSKIKKML